MGSSSQDMPGERLFALKTLEQGKGWKLFLEAAEKNIRKLEDKALDPETTDLDTRAYKLARQFLVQEHSPARVLGTLIRVAEKEAKTETT